MNKTGLVRNDEIRLFLETKNIFLSCLEVESVARRFDKNGDGIITYAEFSQELAPKAPSRNLY
jgi:Ca2+-binding EF-hand superfamily protein